MGFLVLQIGLAAIMLFVTCVAGFIPLALLTYMTKNGKDPAESSWLSFLSCFSGGVFMATCFLDVIPHIGENYESFVSTYGVDVAVPLNQIFICCGFFIVYGIEEITTKVFGNGHGHSHGAAPPKDHQSPPKVTDNVKKDNVTREQLLENGNPFAAPTTPADATDALVPSRIMNRRSLAIEEASPWVVSNEKSNSLKTITFAIAMSFHSLLEGFALGVQEDQTAIYALFFSLVLHKCIESFSVGLQISRANTGKLKTPIIIILIYAVMTPGGAVCGSILRSAGEANVYKDFAILFFECLAAGTFIYVTFLEILAHEKVNQFDSFFQLIMIIFGFTIILGVQFAVGGHDHSAHGGHTHGVSAVPLVQPL